VRLLVLATLACAALALPASPGQAATQKRIAALTPFSANTLAELGVRPVVIGESLGGSDRVFPALRDIPTLPLAHPNGPSLEKLAVFNPDLVLSAPAWRRGTKAMESLGMRVVESEPRSVNAALRDAQRIGALVGRGAKAKQLAERMGREIERSTRKIRKRPRVLLVLGLGQTSFAFLENSWGGDVVRRAGGRLLTNGLRAPGGYVRISDETVLTRDPDIIIAVPHGNSQDIPQLIPYLKDKPGWRETTAARRGHVYISTGNSLLQPWTDIGRIIRDVRRLYLHND
jgi:iron complex transport system substrate-binding protein